MAELVVDPREPNVPVTVFNPNSELVTMYEGTILATCESEIEVMESQVGS